LLAPAITRLTLLIALAAGAGQNAMAQSNACQAARAELAALDRAGAGAATQRLADQIDRLTSYYYAAGCSETDPSLGGARAPECGRTQARIARLEQALVRAGRSDADESRRRDELAVRIEQTCGGTLSASSRPFDSTDMGAPDVGPSNMGSADIGSADIGSADMGSSRVIVDGDGTMRAPDSVSAPLGKAMCVRACDGFYFPLTSSPGGREGADEMCQALCPASPTRAFFLDSGSIAKATDSGGALYGSTPTAFRFRRQISPTCGCKPAGETWSTALKRAEDLIGPQSRGSPDEEALADPARPALRPGASATLRREQAIDPTTRDDAASEPEFIPPDPSGVAVMKPAQPPPEPVRKPAAADKPSTAQTETSRKSVRTVGPPVRYESGPPQPLAPPERH